MKHISEYLAAITQQQLFLLSQIEAHAMRVNELSNSSSIATLATIPQLEADLCVLNTLHGRINRSIQAVNHHR